MGITSVQKAAKNKALGSSNSSGGNSPASTTSVTAQGNKAPEKPKGDKERKVHVSSSSELSSSAGQIEKVIVKPVSVGIEDVDKNTFVIATSTKSVKRFFKYDPTYDKDYRNAFKNPRPASLMVVYKSKDGTTFSDVLKLGILAIAIRRADKAQIISTFGDNFLIQSFGRFPQSITVSGFVISYGTMPQGWQFEKWWESFMSFTSYYEGILAGRRYGEDKTYFTSGLLHYNSVLYYCLFSSFSRIKAVPEDSIETVQMDGLVLKSVPLPDVKVKVSGDGQG